MHMNVKQKGGSSVVHIEGEFLSEPDQDRFRHRIREIVEQGSKHIIVDLTRVSYINSCGLGSLVCGLVAARQAGAELMLMNPAEKVKQLLAITKLDTAFHFTSDVAGAKWDARVTNN